VKITKFKEEPSDTFGGSEKKCNTKMANDQEFGKDRKMWSRLRSKKTSKKKVKENEFVGKLIID
jgi:hypothetical protein